MSRLKRLFHNFMIIWNCLHFSWWIWILTPNTFSCFPKVGLTFCLLTHRLKWHMSCGIFHLPVQSIKNSFSPDGFAFSCSMRISKPEISRSKYLLYPLFHRLDLDVLEVSRWRIKKLNNLFKNCDRQNLWKDYRLGLPLPNPNPNHWLNQSGGPKW